jgi:hypothetical protein
MIRHEMIGITLTCEEWQEWEDIATDLVSEAIENQIMGSADGTLHINGKHLLPSQLKGDADNEA